VPFKDEKKVEYMVTSTTRSINGAAYVPIDWNNKDDPGSEAYRGVNLQRFVSSRIYERAHLLITLLGDRESGAIVINAYRTKYLDPENGELRGAERSDHLRVLNLINAYYQGGSYNSLAKGLKDTELRILRHFTQDWLSLERDILNRSINDMITVTHEAGKDLKVWTNPQRESSNSSNVRHPNIRETEAKSSASNKGLVAIPTSNIWSRMWENNQRRASAKFIAGYIAPRLNLTVLRQKMLNQFVSKIINGVSQVAGGNLPEDSELQIAKGIAQTEGREWASMRERYINIILERMEIEPAGYLALERLDFTPIGYVKGELVYSLPLTPGEKVTVSHKEWSKTTEEYVKTVEESFEEEQEKSISENTELTESTRTEREVTQKGDASVETGYRGASFHVTAKGGWSGTWQNNQATEKSARHAQEITSKAASRSKKEHKLSFKVAREVYSEDEQVRVIENKGDQPVRWDFHRLMQKWKIDLYHIGERLTWDVVIPEPAWFLLRKYLELKDIIDEIEAGDPFDISIEGINEDNYLNIFSKYGATPDPYPREYEFPTEPSVVSPPGKVTRGSEVIRIEVPEGYVISGVKVIYPTRANGNYGEFAWDQPDDEDGHHRPQLVYVSWFANIDENMSRLELGSNPKQKYNWVWTYYFAREEDRGSPRVQLLVKAQPTEEAIKLWRMESWNRLSEASHAQWIRKLEGLQAKRDRLIEELTGRDSLKLRQMEKEEITKAVLRWMLGPEFRFDDPGLSHLPEILTSEWASNPESYENIFERIRSAGVNFGEDIRFLHQAIEWENVNWITYPYFWSLTGNWDFKQSLEHPDFYHRNFLRAGWVRVVLPIRPGFERAWLARMAGLDGEELVGNHPYLSLAREIEARAKEHYAYTPDANRNELVEFGEHKDTWYEYTPTGALDIKQGEELSNQ
jgi:hypothetical protein